MKTLQILSLMLFVNFSVRAQTDEDKKPLIVKTFKNQILNKVNAQTSGGSIIMSSVNPSDARLEVYVNPSNSSAKKFSREELQKRLTEDYDLVISVNNNELKVTAKSKGNLRGNRQLNISYEIYVPQQVSSDLRTSGGSIRLTGLSGKQKFSTSGGSLLIERLKGEIDGSTSGGSIQAENSSGIINLSTSGGSLNLAGLNGTIKANTSGGSINGNNISGELVTNTSGGSVNLNNLSGSVSASTSGGGMNVTLNELGKYVKLSTSGGNIKLDMPGNKGIDLKVDAQRLTVGSLKNFNGQKNEHSIAGTLNGGGIPVNVQASGGVAISFK